MSMISIARLTSTAPQLFLMEANTLFGVIHIAQTHDLQQGGVKVKASVYCTIFKIS